MGDTLTFPAGAATVPIPLSILNVLAPRDFHDSTACWPEVTLAGLAARLTDSGAFTMVWAVAVAVPFVAVIV